MIIPAVYLSVKCEEILGADLRLHSLIRLHLNSQTATRDKFYYTGLGTPAAIVDSNHIITQ